MTELLNNPSRRAVISGIFAASALAAAPLFAGTPAVLRNAGNIRQLRMLSKRTGERVNLIYWVDGNYIPEALHEISLFMRDWRDNTAVRYNASNVDNLAATQLLLRSEEDFTLISGYRSPKTNAMLRARSRGVARNSLHMQGKAADIHMKSRSVAQIARAAASCNGGGVGRYSRSNFVHIDCGGVRVWGR